MEFALLGWPADEPTLRLDYRQFAYAGKFVMTTTGKAVIRTDENGREGGRSEEGGGSEAADGREEAGEREEAGGRAVGSRAGGGAADEPAGRGSGRGPRPDPGTFDRGVLAAAAFNEDRTEPDVLWIRYLTVRADRRGEGLGARLAAFVADRAAGGARDDPGDASGDAGGDAPPGGGYRRVRIAVNNPFAYQALYKAGFGYVGRRTGLAELVLERPADRDRATYQRGLDVFREREDLADVETAFLAAKADAGPPPRVGPSLPGDDGAE